MTAAEKRHLDKVASIGCLICGAPAEIHHMRTICGMSQRANNWMVIPLCPEHHRTGAYGHAIHNGYQEFAKNYQTEADLLAELLRRILK